MHLAEALRYKLGGRGFDSRWCHWNFSLTQSFRLHHVPGVDSASESNEYQEYFLGGERGRCVGLTIIPPSFDDCLQIWEPRSPRTTLRPVQACNGIALHFYFYHPFHLLALPAIPGLPAPQFGKTSLCHLSLCSQYVYS